MLPGKHRILVLGVAVTLFMLVVFGASVTQGESLQSSWAGALPLPTQAGLESCVTNSDYGLVFCIGGLISTSTSASTNQVQFGNFSSGGGISTWSQTTAYPFSVISESCVTYILTVICVGGQLGSTITSNVYTAPISLTGLGSWSSANAYPLSLEQLSCATGGAFIYCVGGFGGLYDNATVYYAPISKTGVVGTWTETTSYPIAVDSFSCVASAGYLYCIGGESASVGYSSVYYAPLSPTGGVGAWAQTTPYPTTIFSHSCTASSGYVYCVGGYAGSTYTNAVYYAPISSQGVGTWTSATAYPNPVQDESCLVFGGSLYCFGGFYNSAMVNNVYYNPIISPPATVTTTVSTTVTTTSTSTSTQTTTATSTTTLSTTLVSTSTTTATLATTATVTTTATTSVTTTVNTGTTSTVTSTSTTSVTLPAQTVTNTQTTTSYLTAVSTSAVTSTVSTFSVSTSTSTALSTTTATVTETQVTRTGTAGAATWLEAAIGAVGLVVGVVLTFIITRVARGSSAREASPDQGAATAGESARPAG